jgi:hypothetical protein
MEVRARTFVRPPTPDGELPQDDTDIQGES